MMRGTRSVHHPVFRYGGIRGSAFAIARTIAPMVLPGKEAVSLETAA